MPRPIHEGIVSWPEDAAAIYRAAGYWEGRSLAEHIWAQADRTPGTIALVDAARRFTYAEVIDRADAAAARLVDRGLVPGDRLLVQLPNGWQFVILTLACLRAGIVPVMALPGHRHHELSYLAELSESAAIAVPDEFRGFDHQELARQLRHEVVTLEHVLVSGSASDDAEADSLETLLEPPTAGDRVRERFDAKLPAPDSVAVFLLSGGTTGLPKLIARTHDDYTYNAKSSAELVGLGPDSVYLVALPAGHNFPLACPGLLGAFMTGGRVVMLPSPEPARVFETVSTEGVTHTAVVPAVAQSWLAHQEEVGGSSLATLEVLQVGGARLPDEVARRIAPELGCTLQQVFGMAEGLLNYTRLDDPIDVIVRTQGRPMSPLDEVRLVDESDRDVAPGEPGSLLTRGPYTPRGYYRAKEHNARSFTEDGWYRSGDICRWDATGNLVVEGRDKDMINRAGEKISAEEVENLTYLLPQVERVAAVAMPDPRLGERVCLYVVVKPGVELTLEDVRESMTQRGVAAFKLPERLVVIDELPQTKVGKIDKKALRADIGHRLEEKV